MPPRPFDALPFPPFTNFEPLKTCRYADPKKIRRREQNSKLLWLSGSCYLSGPQQLLLRSTSVGNFHSPATGEHEVGGVNFACLPLSVDTAAPRCCCSRFAPPCVLGCQRQLTVRLSLLGRRRAKHTQYPGVLAAGATGMSFALSVSEVGGRCVQGFAAHGCPPVWAEARQ